MFRNQLRSIAFLLILQVIPCFLCATPLVVVKTQQGFVVGTNGSIVINGNVDHQTCKPLLVGSFALIWAGNQTLGHMDEKNVYVPDVFYLKDFREVLKQGGNIDTVKARLLRVSEEDTRTLFKKNPDEYAKLDTVGNPPKQDFVLVAYSPKGIQLRMFTSDPVTPYPKLPAEMKFTSDSVSLAQHDVFCWYGGIQHFEEWQFPKSKKTQEAGKEIAFNCLTQISAIYRAGNQVGFDSPFVFVSATPKSIKLIDPEHLCTQEPMKATPSKTK